MDKHEGCGSTTARSFCIETSTTNQNSLCSLNCHYLLILYIASYILSSNMYTVSKTMLVAVSLLVTANGNEQFLMMDTPPMDIPDFRDIPLPGMGDRAMMAVRAMGGSKLDDLSQFVPMMSMWKSTLTEGATSMFDSVISKIKSAYHSVCG